MPIGNINCKTKSSDEPYEGKLQVRFLVAGDADGIFYYRAILRPDHRMVKYLNNIIEQDHRFIKRKVRPMLGFGSFESAEETIAGIEIMHMIRKGQVEEIQCVLSEVEVINKIMSVAA